LVRGIATGPFPKEKTDGGSVQTPFLSDLIGEIALIGKMDGLRIVGHTNKGGRFRFYLGGIEYFYPPAPV